MTRLFTFSNHFGDSDEFDNFNRLDCPLPDYEETMKRLHSASITIISD